MYEAPDRYKRMIAARLPDGESAGIARDSGAAASPLKDVQLIARGQLAPFFALTNIAAAAAVHRRPVGLGRRQPAARVGGPRRPGQLLSPCAGARARR